MYAMETVVWKPTLIQKMVVFQNHIMRWMTNTKLNDRVSLYELERLTKLESIESAIKVRKTKWYGHFKRSNLPVKVVFEGMIEGRRGRGRPQRRWRDDLKEWTDLSWTELNTMPHDKVLW